MKLTIEIRAKPGKCQELYQTLQALLPTIRKEKGCRDCQVYRDVEDGDVFSISVHWETAASLAHYARSGSGGVLLGAIDLLSESARVRTDQETLWEGVEVLKRLRKHT
jgi:hypothetical protein